MTAMAFAVFACALVVVPRSGAQRRVRLVFGTSPAAPLIRALGRLTAVRQPRSRASDQLRIAATWDLLAACLLAGMPVPQALRAVVAGLPADQAGALSAAGERIALGADPDEAWQPVVACHETSAFGRAARRTARSGAALAAVATDLAARARAELTDAAEARAQRAGVLITGPLGLCFLPAFLCLGVVPVVIGLAGQLVTPT